MMDYWPKPPRVRDESWTWERVWTTVPLDLVVCHRCGKSGPREAICRSCGLIVCGECSSIRGADGICIGCYPSISPRGDLPEAYQYRAGALGLF